MSLSRRSFLRFLGLGAVAGPVFARALTDPKPAPVRLVTWSAKVKGPALPNKDVSVSFRPEDYQGKIRWVNVKDYQHQILDKIARDNPYLALLAPPHDPQETP